MSRTTSTANIGRPATHYGDAAPDTGCQYAPRCVDCPWSVCVKELPTRERNDFLVALRLVRSYLAAPDRAITG
jgi:hypothetical protein